MEYFWVSKLLKNELVIPVKSDTFIAKAPLDGVLFAICWETSKVEDAKFTSETLESGNGV